MGRKVIAIWLCLTMLLGMIMIVIEIVPKVIAFTPHDPYRINSNGEFASIAGLEGWIGDGSPGNPYIIEGYDINGSGYGYCIYIGNTTVHFKVKDCYLYKSSGLYNSPDYFESGLELFRVHNGIIANNTVLNFDCGIYLYKSSNNTIANNNASSNNIYGINIYKSSNTTIKNNEMLDNGINIGGDMLEHWNSHNIDTTNSVNGKPVYYWKNQISGTVPMGAGQVILANSINVIVENQNVSDGTNGILLGFSSNNTIANNTASSNNLHSILFFYSNGNTIANNTASSNYGFGIFLSSSSSNTIINNKASNNSKGIGLWYSDGNTVDNNTASLNDWYGILVYYSSSNTIINNTVSLNYYHGISLSGSDNNLIANNTVSSNKHDGIEIMTTGSNIITNNEMVDNGIEVRGHYLEHWISHIIDTTNTVNGKPVYYWKNRTGGTVPLGAGQVILANCTNVIVENLIVSDGSFGIQLGFSNNNTIANNTASINNEDGIYLCKSSSNTIVNNTVSSNNRSGIYLVASINNTIIDNIASSNNLSGISLNSGSINNTIIDNIASSNTKWGIYLFGSRNNKIYHNNIISNTYQAYNYRDKTNQWDNGYPSGGNYWSDYSGVDNYRGVYQNISGSDGIGDTPYYFNYSSFSVQDNYPLMCPWNGSIFTTFGINPNTLNLRSKGRWITCYITLNDPYDVNDIDNSSILLEYTIPAEWGDIQGDTLMVKFDRSDVEDMLPPGTYNLKVTGELADGTSFEGYSDEIRVINPP